MRAAAIDFGERRIGVAITAPEGSFALPLATIERRSDRQALAALVELLGPRGVERLFVGEPRPASGREAHPAGSRVQRFGRRLAGRLGVPVAFIDERWSTLAAEQSLPPDRRGARGRVPIDALAAQQILESALDLWRRGLLPEPPA